MKIVERYIISEIRNMRSNNNPKTNSFKNKIYLFVITSFFCFLLIMGLKAVMAYYVHDESLSILGGLIGDFDIGDGDVNIILYRKDGNSEYVKSHSIPEIGYDLDHVKCTRTCNTNTSSNCYYVYNGNPNTIELHSNELVTCKFFFDSVGDSDIDINIMLEDENGTTNYNSKHYSLVETIPAYGYRYYGGTCDNNVTPTYVSGTRIFKVNTQSKTTCYAYFDKDGDSDITVNTYIQTQEGGSVYERVESIPANKEYVISSGKQSLIKCVDGLGDTVTIPTYNNGYINVTTTEKVTCDIYLDLQ